MHDMSCLSDPRDTIMQAAHLQSTTLVQKVRQELYYYPEVK